MIWVLIAAPVAVVALVVGSNIVGGRQMRRVLAEFDAETGTEPGTELVPVLPAVSTLPEPGPDGWSAEVGFNAWAAWLDARHAATFPAEPVLFTELAGRYLAEPQRELEGATR